MQTTTPASADELAESLRAAAASGQTIEILGNGSKRRAGGAIAPSAITVSTSALDQVLQYEPKDLTVSVGAGMPYARFTEMLAKDGYMVPLDPPFAQQATMGGVIAANSSGPRRRIYGTPRDLLIGMQFATMEGKLVQSGGMVVKNVAGLDMGKLLIGSLGTLAAITVVNFKLIPMPPLSRTFVFSYADANQALQYRDKVLQSVLQPVAVDLLSPQGAAGCNRQGWLLALGVNGNAKVLDRYKKEFAGAEILENDAERGFWQYVQEYTPRFLDAHPEGAVVRHSFPLRDVSPGLANLAVPVVVRAANGVCYSFHETPASASSALAIGKAIMEFGPSSRRNGLVMWPQTDDSGFQMMMRIKNMFDPGNLLNPGRFYGRF